MTILVVDDDRAIRNLMTTVLRQIGATVLCVSDGATALTHAMAVHLLITDVNMEGIPGPRLAAHFRALHPKLRVLYITGDVDGLLASHTLLPHEAVLGKPFAASELLDRVRAMIREADSTNGS